MLSIYCELVYGRQILYVSRHLVSQRYSCTQTKSLLLQHSDANRLDNPKHYLSPLTQSWYSTQPAKGTLTVRHKEGINKFVQSLTKAERLELLNALSKTTTASTASPDQVQNAIPPLTASQLSYVALFGGVPFIGFGLLDNTIMLTAGEYIDITFGAMLGITTMAAAALGNMVSDVLGITTAGFVEQSAVKLGFKPPDLTIEQKEMRSSRWAANFGRCFGVCIGCLLGMWPLLFLHHEKDEAEKDEKSSTEKDA